MSPLPPPPPPMPENGFYIPEPKEPPPTLLIVMNITNTITHLLLGAIAVSAFVYANYVGTINSLFVHNSYQQHIYLCVTGYVILMSQAVLSMSPFSGWANSFKYEQRKTIHWVMQICGSILALAGSCVRIANVGSHFSTAHGSIGIIAMIFTFISLISGVINLFTGNLKLNTKIIKLCHSCFGSLTLVLAFLSLIFGFDKFSFRNSNSGASADMLIAFTIFALVGTLTPAWFNLIRRFNGK